MSNYKILSIFFLSNKFIPSRSFSLSYILNILILLFNQELLSLNLNFRYLVLNLVFHLLIKAFYVLNFS
jgi:hypothetical protein